MVWSVPCAVLLTAASCDVDPAGEIIYRPGSNHIPSRRHYPDLHDARSTCNWPYFAKFGKPRDPAAWAALVAGDSTPVPDESSHLLLSPKPHQVAALCNIMARAFHPCPNWTTALFDEPGLGKTWEALMLPALLKYYRDHDVRAPIMTRQFQDFDYEW